MSEKIYPKFVYHKEFGAKLIESEADEKALEGEWKDTPAAFENEASAEIQNQSDEKSVSEKPKRKPKKDAE